MRFVDRFYLITFQNLNHMKTSKPLTRQLTLDELILFQEGFPVSHLARQDNVPGQPTTAIYGRKCLERFEKLAPPMSWPRTFAASLVGMKGWFSTRCALTWKVKATKSSRSYFLLQASTRRTAVTESGLLLTPTTREEPVDLDKFKARMEKYPNGTTMPNLATQVQQMLPTPVAWDGNGGGARKPKDGKANALGYSLTLKDRAAAKMLPTPQANCSKGMNAQNVELRGNKLYNKKTGKQIQSSPEQWAKMGMLPTPMAQEHDKITGKENQDSLTKRARQQTGKTSQLSPLFVEEMMGFPKGWTASPFQSGDENQ